MTSLCCRRCKAEAPSDRYESQLGGFHLCQACDRWCLWMTLQICVLLRGIHEPRLAGLLARLCDKESAS